MNPHSDSVRKAVEKAFVDPIPDTLMEQVAAETVFQAFMRIEVGEELTPHMQQIADMVIDCTNTGIMAYVTLLGFSRKETRMH